MSAGVPGPILIISFSYAPVLNARAFRWTALAELWAQRGTQVDVVTSWSPGLPETEQRGRVNVYRTGISWIDRLRHAMREQRSALQKSSATDMTARRSHIQPLLAFINERVWRNLFWPDTTCLWYPSASRIARKLLATHAYRAVVSVAPSFTAVVIGRGLKREQPHLRWIIDLGDPFCFLEDAPPNNLCLYRHLNVRYERNAFAAAAAISVTTPDTAQRYAALFPESAGKIVVIPPLLSSSIKRTRSRTGPNADRVRLVYIGTFYRNIREPDFLLSLFEKAADCSDDFRMELHFYGDSSSCTGSFNKYRPLAQRGIYVHGVVDRDRVVAAVAEADILINIGNDTTYQLPSKVVEYAAAAKPIINIAKSHGDSSVGFFADYPQKLDLFDTGAAPDAVQCAAFREFIARPGPAITDAALAAFLRPHTLKAVAADYEHLLCHRTE